MLLLTLHNIDCQDGVPAAAVDESEGLAAAHAALDDMLRGFLRSNVPL